MTDKGSGNGFWTRLRGRWPGGRLRWLHVLLGASLALNLFVAGWVGVRYAHWEEEHRGGEWHGHSHEFGDRDGFRKVMLELAVVHAPGVIDVVTDAIPELRAVADELERDPLDEERLQLALESLQGSGAIMLGIAAEVSGDAAERMSLRERKAAARRVRRVARGLERRFDRWRDRLSDE